MRSFYDGAMGYEWWAPGLAMLVGVEPHEVSQVLAARRRLPLDATFNGLRVIAIYGRTARGRLLAVLIRQVAGHDQQILFARVATDNERMRFEAWEAIR